MLTDEKREQWIDAFERAYRYVPLSQYDEVTKLALYAFEEMVGMILHLESALRDIELETSSAGTSYGMEPDGYLWEGIAGSVNGMAHKALEEIA